MHKKKMTYQPQHSTFSDRVKVETDHDHGSDGSRSFVGELMTGKRNIRDYAILLSQYHYIYEALDSSADALRDSTDLPGVAVLLDPKLDRRAALQKDLGSLLPESGLSNDPLQLTATESYADRIREVSEVPELLTAHHYLRYLGDLHGGLAIAKMVKRHYALPDNQLNMYHFKSIPKPKPYKDLYRDRLDQIGFTRAQEDAFIQEVLDGFGYHKAIFDELLEYSPHLSDENTELLA